MTGVCASAELEINMSFVCVCVCVCEKLLSETEKCLFQ